jgi:hypothetical protein
VAKRLGKKRTEVLTEQIEELKLNSLSITGELEFDDGSDIRGNILPSEHGTYNLGADDARFANVYTQDLHLRNERGDWTLVEEEDMLTVRNNKTGKLYKIVLQELNKE